MDNSQTYIGTEQIIYITPFRYTQEYFKTKFRTIMKSGTPSDLRSFQSLWDNSITDKEKKFLINFIDNKDILYSYSNNCYLPEMIEIISDWINKFKQENTHGILSI